MERKKHMTVTILGVLIGLAVLGGLSTLFFKDDNPIEEACEEIIKETTGLEIDLTPNSPEASKEENNTEASVTVRQKQKV